MAGCLSPAWLEDGGRPAGGSAGGPIGPASGSLEGDLPAGPAEEGPAGRSGGLPDLVPDWPQCQGLRSILQGWLAVYWWVYTAIHC